MTEDEEAEFVNDAVNRMGAIVSGMPQGLAMATTVVFTSRMLRSMKVADGKRLDDKRLRKTADKIHSQIISNLREHSKNPNNVLKVVNYRD